MKKTARKHPLAEAHTRKAILDHLAAGRLKLTTATPEQPVNVSLTIDERDAIDAAKGRLCRLINHIRNVASERDHDQEPWIEDLLDIMDEDVNIITAQLAGADERQADDVKGGA